MATFDLTAKATAGVGADVLAVPTVVGHPVKTIEAILDIDAMIAAGATIADGDVFQLLEVPSESVVRREFPITRSLLFREFLPHEMSCLC